MNIAPAIGKMKLAALTKAAVQRMVNNIQKGAKPPAPATVIRIHACLHKALKQAVEMEYVKGNAADKCNTNPR